MIKRIVLAFALLAVPLTASAASPLSCPCCERCDDCANCPCCAQNK